MIPGLVAVVAVACGGATTADNASPRADDGPGGSPPGVEANPTSDASPSEESITSSESPDCRLLRQQTLEALDSAVSQAPKTCQEHGDCLLYGRRPDCVYDCGFFAAVAEWEGLDSEIDRVDADLCPAQCVQIPSSCGGGLSADQQPMARCEAGACEMRTWGEVFESRFEQTLYPLLVSHCQDCHDSTSTQGGSSFADAQVATAIGATFNVVVWERDPAGVRMAEPEESRLVQYVSEQEHNCWGDCAENARELTLALELWAEGE